MISNLEQLTELLIILSFKLGVVFIGLSMILCLFIVIIRFFLYVEEVRNKKLAALWRPIFAECLYSIPKALPVIKKNEQFSFMLLWTYFQESLRGDSKDKLNVLARCVNLNALAIKYLGHKNKAKRLVAIMTIGHLGDRTAWKDLRAIAKGEESTVLSLTAANALCKIDGKFAAPVVIPLIRYRKDWPANKIGTLLFEIGPYHIAEPLIDCIADAESDDKARLISFLRFCSHEKALPVIRKIMERNPAEQIIANCLKLLGYFADKRDLEIIKKYLDHDLWYIRVQAVNAFGKIATIADQHYLIKRLTDKEWWVRYRAAQALIALPYMTESMFAQIITVCKDRFARDILIQVAKERE